MQNKKIILFLFFLSFFSYSYSTVSWKFDSVAEDHTQYTSTGHDPIIIYQPHVTITRTSPDEPIDITIPTVKLYDIGGRGNWLSMRFVSNQATLDSHNITLSLTDLKSNSPRYSFRNTWNHFRAIGTDYLGSEVNVAANFHLTIQANTPDFKNVILGSFRQQGTTTVDMGTLSLVTLNPLTVEVPDIDFGDVIIDSGSQTKSGVITVKGTANTKITFDISNPHFKLHKVGDPKHSIKATANIDGRTIRQEDYIRNDSNLTKTLNITISKYSNLPPGKYSGDLIININSN